MTWVFPPRFRFTHGSRESPPKCDLSSATVFAVMAGFPTLPNFFHQIEADGEGFITGWVKNEEEALIVMDAWNNEYYSSFITDFMSKSFLR